MRSLALTSLLVALSVLAFGCASDLRRDAVVMAAAEQSEQEVLKVTEDAQVRLSSGYARTIAAGSEWRSIGYVSTGKVYQPVGRVFSIEGAHVHEAYIVLKEGYLVGFYLPGEGKLSVLNPPVRVKTDRKG